MYPEDSKKLEVLNEQVVFNGRQPHKVVLDNIVISDFTIFLRDVTRVTLAGFPSKFSESITYGTPVITNLISNIEPYIVEGRNCYLVDIDNAEKRYHMMKSVLSLTPKSVQVSKEYCFDSSVFYYLSFNKAVSAFLNKINQ